LILEYGEYTYRSVKYYLLKLRMYEITKKYIALK